MNTSIVGRQITLSEAIKSYIENTFENLTKYKLDIISIRSVVSADERGGKKGFWAEFSVNLAGLDTIVIKQKNKDLYAAIDLAYDRVAKMLRRIHDKNITKKQYQEQQLPQTIIEESEIVPSELELYKPQEIEEALAHLKQGTDIFYVFYDIDAKLRVIFKKKDGRYGLY